MAATADSRPTNTPTGERGRLLSRMARTRPSSPDRLAIAMASAGTVRATISRANRKRTLA